MPHATDPLTPPNRARPVLGHGRGPERLDVVRVAPNRWCHEVPAIVGPFCCRARAAAFASPPVDFGHYEGQRRRVERRGDAFYVYVR